LKSEAIIYEGELKMKRSIVEIDEELCNGCGLCIPNCAEGALDIVNNKAKLVSDVYCDGLGACLGHCPQDAIKIIEREADPFDEGAVHDYLAQIKAQSVGCPSIASVNLDVPPLKSQHGKSALRNWPVQLNLVPFKSSMFNDADLLVVADCVPIAHPNFHSSLLSGRTIVMGCPKFDNIKDYAQKLGIILEENNIRSITVATMEVPCCSALNRVLDLAVESSGKFVPIRKHVVSVKGDMI
jgi:ferredoxin